MATGTIPLSIAAAMMPDGNAGNASPQYERVQGTEANPKKHLLTVRFDPATEEFIYWNFRMPTDANAAPAPVLKIQWASLTAVTATNVVWGAALGAITPSDVDTPIEHALAAQTNVTSANNTTEAGRLIEASIAFANLDGLAANDLVVVRLSRVAGDASDTLAEDARLYAVTFEYTI